MPVYQIDIEKSALNVQAQTVYWTNVYHVVSASQSAAVTAGGLIVAWEKTIHAANTSFTKMRTRPAGVPGNVGTITVLSGVGARTTPTDVMPMFCVARVDFSKAVGRPCRKYLRIFIGESEQANGVIASSLLTTITNNYITPAVAAGWVCDEDGDLIVAGTAMAPVQMRQLRRGSKRKVTPVI